MLNRQFSLIAVVALLLSANAVDATELDGNKDLSVGNVKIQTTENGTRIQTPGVQIDSARVAVSRTRRRTRTNIRRTTKPSKPLIFNKKVSTDSQTTVTTTTTPSGSSTTTRTTTTTTPSGTTIMRTTNGGDSSTVINNSSIERSSRNSTVRSTRIRNSSDDGDNVSEQEQSTSTSCSSGSGSTVIQSSSTTINGRTVRSQSRTNCN